MDVLLRGGQLVDGSGLPARRADVGITGSVISHVSDEPITEPARNVIDLSGLVLSPGFIDVHTHYDAQVFWDPDMTPSSWHGVTTVVMGNCGFGIAPTRPEHRHFIAMMLENVEGMSMKTLDAGLTWDFETFPQYLDAVAELPKRINVAAMLGHSPVRIYAMGEDAIEREATTDEIEWMRATVDEAIGAGAVGFATSKALSHRGAYDRPVPSRLAGYAEICELVEPLRCRRQGTFQATVGPGLLPQQFADIAMRIDRPVTWTALLTGMAEFDTYRGDAEMGSLAKSAPAIVDEQARLGGEVWPQISGLPLIIQMSLRQPTQALRMTPSMQELLHSPEVEWEALCADDTWRRRARAEAEAAFGDQWSKVSIGETSSYPELVGTPLDVLAERRSVSPFDLLIDIAVADRFDTRFRVLRLNDDEAELSRLLNDKRVILGLSDAGAHADQLCDARFATHLLEHWVRERGAIPLELAIWRLTGQPAHVFRLPGRGIVREGYVADLVAFNPDTVGHGPLRRVWDCPGGADRLVTESHGIEHMWVNGVQICAAGQHVPNYPGQLIRSQPGL